MELDVLRPKGGEAAARPEQDLLCVLPFRDEEGIAGHRLHELLPDLRPLHLVQGDHVCGLRGEEGDDEVDAARLPSLVKCFTFHEATEKARVVFREEAERLERRLLGGSYLPEPVPEPTPPPEPEPEPEPIPPGPEPPTPVPSSSTN